MSVLTLPGGFTVVHPCLFCSLTCASLPQVGNRTHDEEATSGLMARVGVYYIKELGMHNNCFFFFHQTHHFFNSLYMQVIERKDRMWCANYFFKCQYGKHFLVLLKRSRFFGT